MSATSQILVLNSGSSSLKFGLYAPGASEETPVLTGSAEEIGRAEGTLRVVSATGEVLRSEQHVLETQEQALAKTAAAVKQYAGRLAGIGHRIVHGGPHLVEHQRITPAVVITLQESVHFAPLHIPQSLRLVQLAEKHFPGVTNFACFDTAFHRHLPDVASHLPLPQEYFAEGIRRYGFHGLSYESIVHRLGKALPERAVLAHLGNGSSVAAVHRGTSIDTSMGLTPTGGVVMSSRSGDLDPGVLVYLARAKGLTPDAMEALLNHRCGLAGLSDGDSDMQSLLAKEAGGDSAAHLAVEAFCTSVKKMIGAYAALMGGVDLLVFTGGIGWHSSQIRARICAGLEMFGLAEEQKPPAGKVLAVQAEEELQIARHVRRLLAAETSSA
jgi:acetate kinase